MNVAIMQHSCKYVNRELCSNPVKQNIEMDNSSGKRIMNATKTISVSHVFLSRLCLQQMQPAPVDQQWQQVQQSHRQRQMKSHVLEAQ